MPEYEIRNSLGEVIGHLHTISDLQVDTESKDSATQTENYKECVLECHKVLDDINIPSAKGVNCSDPECKSSLGHRLRTLRDSHTHEKKLLVRIEEVLKTTVDKNSALYLQLKEIQNGTREH